MSKLGIIITYVLAALAFVLVVESLMFAAEGSVEFAGYLAALACFALLLGVWVSVCS